MPQDRRFTDDLPSIGIARLRAEGVISAETTEFLIKLADVEQTIAVYLRNFPNGGSWSLFIAPCCGKKVRVLRLLNGRLLCCRCCRAHGMLYRSDPMSPINGPSPGVFLRQGERGSQLQPRFP